MRIASRLLLLALLGSGCAASSGPAVPTASAAPTTRARVEPLDARQSALAAAFLAERDRAHLLVLASPT